MAEVLPLIKQSLESLAHGQLPPVEVLKLLLSKFLGYGIIAGATLVKLPQISNVARARSAEGLAAVSFELESWALLVHGAYGYLRRLPFSAYGEALLLLAQNLLLLALVYKYSGAGVWRPAVGVALLAGAVGAVVSGHADMRAVSALYDANNLTLLAARLPQIAKNFSARSTGQLSIITYGLNFAGGCARIFTTLQEKGGSAMLRAHMLGVLLNFTIVAQILIFGNRSAAQAAAAKAKTKKKQ